MKEEGSLDSLNFVHSREPLTHALKVEQGNRGPNAHFVRPLKRHYYS